MNSRFPVTQLFIILATTLLTKGCSLAAWQRVGYETVQNVKEQQCQKDFPRDKEKEAECQTKEDYDTYQKRRQKL